MDDLLIDTVDTRLRKSDRAVTDSSEADGQGVDRDARGGMQWRDVSALGAEWDGYGPPRWRADGPDGSHWLVEWAGTRWTVYLSGYALPGVRRAVQAIHTATLAQGQAVAERYASEWAECLRYRLRGMPLPSPAYEPSPRDDDELVSAAIRLIESIDHGARIYPGDAVVAGLRAAIGGRS